MATPEAPEPSARATDARLLRELDRWARLAVERPDDPELDSAAERLRVAGMQEEHGRLQETREAVRAARAAREDGDVERARAALGRVRWEHVRPVMGSFECEFRRVEILAASLEEIEPKAREGPLSARDRQEIEAVLGQASGRLRQRAERVRRWNDAWQWLGEGDVDLARETAHDAEGRLAREVREAGELDRRLNAAEDAVLRGGSVDTFADVLRSASERGGRLRGRAERIRRLAERAALRRRPASPMTGREEPPEQWDQLLKVICMRSTSWDGIPEGASEDERIAIEEFFGNLDRLANARGDVLGAARSLAQRTLDSLRDDLDGYPAFHYWSAVVWRLAGRPRRAKEEAVFATRLAPAFAEAHALAGRLLLDLNDVDGAARHLEEARRLRPDWGPAALWLALVRHRQGRGRDAAAELDAAASVLVGEHARQAVEHVREALSGPRGIQHRREANAFVVHGEGPLPGPVEDAAKILDAALPLYASLVGRSAGAVGKKAVYLISDESKYRRFQEFSGMPGGNDWGFYDPALDALYTYLRGIPAAQFRATVMHEGFHAYASKTLGPIPIWWEEAIAEYCAGARIEGGTVVEGGFPGEPMEAFRRWFESGGVPSRAAMTEQVDAPGGGVDPYVAEWSVVHYLRNTDAGGHRPALARFLDLLRRGHEVERAYDAAFGFRADIASGWRAHVARLLGSGEGESAPRR